MTGVPAEYLKHLTLTQLTGLSLICVPAAVMSLMTPLIRAQVHNSWLQSLDDHATDLELVIDCTQEKQFGAEDGQSDDSEFHTLAQPSKRWRRPSVTFSQLKNGAKVGRPASLRPSACRKLRTACASSTNLSMPTLSTPWRRPLGTNLGCLSIYVASLGQ